MEAAVDMGIDLFAFAAKKHALAFWHRPPFFDQTHYRNDPFPDFLTIVKETNQADGLTMIYAEHLLKTTSPNVSATRK